jgi:hypothetical protein
LLLSLVTFRTVKACGGFFCQPQQPVLQAGENIAFGVSQNDDNSVDVTMAIQINYQGPAEAFAWILPVPAEPTISTGSDILFDALFEVTRPTFEFTINNTKSTTCDQEELEQFLCATNVADDGAGFAGGDGQTTVDRDVVVLTEGTVGPFQFVTLEVAEEGRPEALFEWLQDNDYDQPEQAEPLVTYYAGMGMKFVALQLLKDSDVGEITPVILEYKVDGSLSDTPVACVPIQLTSIAATPDMPIQVYLFGPHRGIPFNYVEVNIDESFIDWITCDVLGQDCYLNDWRNLLSVAAEGVNGHAFVTEYAGDIGIVTDVIALKVELSELYTATEPLAFLNKLNDANVPDITLVRTIIERHIPNKIIATGKAPQFCQTLQWIYTPDTMGSCVEFVDFGGDQFDPVALANELDDQVFQPAQKAQTWVNSYAYMTRIYAQMDPEQMVKDPFFAFNEEEENVSREHKAEGVPFCDNTGPVAMDISVEGTGSLTRVDAILGCGSWIRTGVGTLFGSVSPAVSMTGFSFAGEESSTLFRDPGTGQFAVDEVEDLIDVLDDRVSDQTVPGRMDPPTFPPVGNNSGAHQILPLGLLATGAMIVAWGLLYGDLVLF